jgi:hypothetical protein
MKRNKGEFEKVFTPLNTYQQDCLTLESHTPTAKAYTTLDSYIAGFLSLKGHIPTLIEQGEKVVFSFPVCDQLFVDLSAYSDGEKIEASKLAFAIKSLKSQIFSMRRDKEKSYAKEQRQ